jgi:hypothetical protein
VTTPPVPSPAYLVLSHKNPAQVESLVARILELSPAGEVWVHHDVAATDVPWNGSPPPRVHLVDPMHVLWGDFTVVEASLRLLRAAVDQGTADWFVMLSGEDRPVRDLVAWEEELAASDSDGFVPARPLVQRPALGHRPTADDLNYVRYAHRWRSVRPPRSGPARRALGLARRMSRYVQPWVKIEFAHRRDHWFLGVRRRQRLPDAWTLYAGSQWMAFNARAAAALLDADPAVTQWFRHTWIPDQGYFHTVLYNEPGLRLRNAVVTYVVPHDTTKRDAWMTITTADLDAIARSGAAFARKFDPAVDPTALAVIDAAIDSARPTPTP